MDDTMCETCKCFVFSGGSEPCKECDGRSNWVSEDDPEIKNCKNCYFATVMEKPCWGCEDDKGVFRNWMSDSFDPDKLKGACDNCKYYDAENDEHYDAHCTDCHIMSTGRLSDWQPIESETTAKHDTGKPRCDLVSPALIEAVGHVRGYGSIKYNSDDNWQSVESSRFMAALIRHLCHCMRDLNSVDEESGLPHLWHVATNVNFLMERVEVKE